MMKKFYLFTKTLLAVALLTVASNAWGGNVTIFSYTVAGVPANQSAQVYSYDASGAIGGTCSFNVTGTSGNVGYFRNESNINSYNFGAGAAYVLMTLPQGETFKTGDVITIRAYCTNNNYASRGFYINADNSSSGLATSNYSNRNAEANTLTATLTSTYNGQNALYIKRNGGGDFMSVSVARTSSAPTISVSGAPDESVAIGASVTLNATTGGLPTPTIQWYSNTTNSNTDGTEIVGATSKSYSPSTAAAGTTYYYAVVTSSEGSATSDVQTVTVDNIISATINAKCGEEILETEEFSVENGETIYYGWKKYILKDGVLYNNQQRTAGAQFTGSTTTTVNIDKEYSVVNLGTATAEYYNELGTGVTQGGSAANYIRSSHGNTSSVSSTMTLASAGTLPVGTYTFELGNYKNRKSIIKVGDANVGVTATGSNSGTYVVTTLNNIVVLENQVVTVTKSSSSAATDEIDYFLAIRTSEGTTVSKTISSIGWATYCSPYALDLANATGLTDAFIVTGGADGVLAKTSVKSGTVPANTGLLLQAPTGTVTIPVVESSSTNVSSNKLVGVTSETAGVAAGIYVLLNGVDDTSGPVGFYKTANAFTISANTAYLPADFTSGVTPAREAYFFDGVTGINEAQAAEAVQKEGKFVIDGKFFIFKNGKKYNANGTEIK